MSFWKAASEVPPDLKQRLALNPGSLSPISDDLFQDRSSDVRFRHLLRSNGQYTPYQVLFTANELSVKDVNLGVVIEQIAFEAGVNIVDVSYLPTADGTFGLVVAYNHGSPQAGCLVRLVRFQTDAGLQAVYKLAIPHKISAVSVIISDDEEKPRQLTSRMAQWNNVVAVGTHFGHGYVVYLPVLEEWTSSTEPVVKGLTDATRSFHRSDAFVYRVRDGSQGEMRVSLRDTYVSSIGYIARSCVLMFGFSFGGLIQVSITDGGEITCNSIVSTSPVRHIVGLLPHDDPNMHIWFFVTYGSAEKGLKIALFEGFFEVAKGQENVPALDRDFLNPMFVPKFVEKFPVGCRWITAQALVRERNGNGREESDESMNVTLNDTDMDYSQLFYAFRAPQDDIMCGIFDLNTYYFKRLLQSAYTDSTVARQCAFLSLAAGPLDLPVETDSITSMTVDPNQMSKFQFAEDPEQQLYASSINLRWIHVGSTRATFKLSLPSLPSQVLDRVYEDLTFQRNPHEAVRSLTAVGLMPPFASQERQTELGVVLVCAVFYGKLRSILKVISETVEDDWPSLRKVSEWLSDESKRTRNNIDSMVGLLFSELRGMSAEQNKQLNQIHRVTNAAKRIYASIHRLFVAWQKENSIPQGIAAEVEVHFVAAKNLASYVNCITNLCRAGYLPMGDRKREERRELEEGVSERRNAHRLNCSPRPLFIDRVVQKMQNCTPNEPLWLDQGASEWYPPALHNALPLLLPWTVPDKLKKDFIIYFFCDLVVATRQLGFGKERHVYELIPAFVSNLLEGVLGINSDAVFDVFRHWINESQPVRTTETLPVLEPNPGLEDANSKITAFLKNDNLSADEEKLLKELCAGVPFGKYRWQLYLIGRGRFDEVKMLDAAPESSNAFERLYAQAIPGVRRLRQYATRWQNSLTTAPALPEDILKKIKDFDPASKEAAPSGPKFNPKTPVALFKRMRRAPAAQVVPEEEEKFTPDAKRSRIDHDVSSLCSTPTMPNLQPEQLQHVAEILRTPTSRRVRAAAAVENQTGICVTPENTVPIPQPTSILRTPIRKMTSPARCARIKWDPEFVEPSLNSTGIESAHDEEEMDEMEDGSVEEANETLEVDMEKQDERTEESVVEEQEEEEEATEKSVEAQEEVEQEIEEQEEADELEKTEEIQDEMEKEDDEDAPSASIQEKKEDSLPAIKLVDYSLTDSTFMETPPRATQSSVFTSNSRRWMDSDGIEHSFEQQEEEKSENPLEEVEKSFEEQKEEEVVIEEAVEQQAEEEEDEQMEENQDATESFAIDPPVIRDRSFVEFVSVESRIEVSEGEGIGDTFVIASPQRRWEDPKAEEAPEQKSEMMQEDTVDNTKGEMEVEAKEDEQQKEVETESAVVKKSPGRPRKASTASSDVEPLEVLPARRSSSRRSVSTSVAPVVSSEKIVEKEQAAEEKKEEEPVKPTATPKAVSPPKEVLEEKSTRRSGRGRSVPISAAPIVTEPEAPREEEPQSTRRSARKSPSRANSTSEASKKKPAAARLLFPAEKKAEVVEEATEDETPAPSTAETPRKRGRPARTTAPTPPRVTRSSSRDIAPKAEEKTSSAVASFKAKMAKAREEAGMATRVSTRKRTASESGVPSTSAKKPVIVPASIDEEPRVAAATPRRSASVSGASTRRRSTSRSRAAAQPSIPEETEPSVPPTVTRSPGRKARKTSESSEAAKPVRSSSRSRAQKTTETAPESLPPRRTPSRTRKEASGDPEPVVPASKRGKSPARAVSGTKESTDITQAKKSPGRPRKASSTSTTAEPVEIVPARRSSSRRSVTNSVPPPAVATLTPRRGARK